MADYEPGHGFNLCGATGLGIGIGGGGDGDGERSIFSGHQAAIMKVLDLGRKLLRNTLWTR